MPKQTQLVNEWDVNKFTTPELSRMLGEYERILKHKSFIPNNENDTVNAAINVAIKNWLIYGAERAVKEITVEIERRLKETDQVKIIEWI